MCKTTGACWRGVMQVGGVVSLEDEEGGEGREAARAKIKLRVCAVGGAWAMKQRVAWERQACDLF